MKNVRIQDDLYEFVNGQWLENAVIPNDRPTTGGFANLDQDVEKLLMADFRAFAADEKTSDINGMKDAILLYKKIMDTKTRNEQGIRPALPLLHRIQSIHTIDELNQAAFELGLQGMPLPFEFGVTEDMQDATKNCFVMLGPSIILPDTTYYGTENGDKLLGVFQNMAQAALAKTDLSAADQAGFLADTLAFDALVAKKVKSKLEWADYVKNYNPMALADVAGYVNPMDIKQLLQQIYDKEVPDTIIVYDPKAIKELNGYFNEDTFPLYLHWAYVKTLLNCAATLSEELTAISTIFRRTLMGVQEDPVLEKKAYQTAAFTYAEPVGLYYGRTYFGEEAKKDIISLVKKIIETYKIRVANNAFLEEATKQKAILKLSTIRIKMGYPDEVRPLYDKLHLDETDTYFDAMQKISSVKSMDELQKLNKAVDKTEWQMPGHLVNACYDPGRNDITFPAAILQKPFYALSQSVSENLGGIGAVIAHEISHAFDNNGSHFDENGNLFNWWTEKDLAAFKELTQKMIEQWDKIPFCGDFVNGELVVSENIADNGGMAVTLQILHTLPDADFAAYFKNWARIWCQKAKPEYLMLRLKNDVHSPTPLRANIQVRNFSEWYEAFDVQPTDQMYIAPEKRIIIW